MSHSTLSLGRGFTNVRRRSSVQVNCRTERRRALKNILERTAMVVEMVVKNRRAGRPRPEVVHQPEPCLSMTLTPPTVAGLLTANPPERAQGCSHDLFDAGRACPTA